MPLFSTQSLRPAAMLLFVAVLVILQESCNKDPEPQEPTGNEPDTVVTTPPDPPKPPLDTVNYVQRVEVDYLQSNPPVNRKNRAYTFYYDNLHRVTSVGIRNYDPIFFDTATSLLFYTGSSLKPYKVVVPNYNASSKGQPVNYDTIYFSYNASNQITSDSAYQPLYNPATASIIKRPGKRTYSYSATHTYIEWYAPQEAAGVISLTRRDTIQHTSDSLLVKLKTQFYYSATQPLNYAIGEGFTYSGYINPLAQLNISGTIFSLIYTSVNTEILGNQQHKAVLNSNILPFYLDFYSAKIPTQFYLGGFTASGFLIAAQYDMFTIQITPWSLRNKYPSQISVGASTALDDKVVCRYYY